MERFRMILRTTAAIWVITLGIVALRPGPASAAQPGDSQANPAWVRSVDDPTRQPFAFYDLVEVPSGTTGIGIGLIVPAGKRLVMEYVSARATLPTGQFVWMEVWTNSVGGGLVAINFFAGVRQGVTSLGAEVFIVGQQTRLYAEPGTSVVLFVNRNGGPSGDVTVPVSAVTQ